MITIRTYKWKYQFCFLLCVYGGVVEFPMCKCLVCTLVWVWECTCEIVLSPWQQKKNYPLCSLLHSANLPSTASRSEYCCSLCCCPQGTPFWRSPSLLKGSWFLMAGSSLLGVSLFFIVHAKVEKKGLGAHDVVLGGRITISSLHLHSSYLSRASPENILSNFFG